METIRAAGCCSAPPKTWTFAVANTHFPKIEQRGATPPPSNNDTRPPQAGFPLPYIMKPLPDLNVPITSEEIDENTPPLDYEPEPITNPPYQPFEEPGRTDEYYRRYLKLAQNVAHKYPNPGLPIERHGRAGASWRHIKEVQSHNNRVLYVDGIVRLYDQDYLSSFASRHMPPGFGKPQADSHIPRQVERKTMDTDWAPTQKARPINATTTFLPGNPIKYKGFYNYK